MTNTVRYEKREDYRVKKPILYQMEEVMRHIEDAIGSSRISPVITARKLMQELLADYLGQVESSRSEAISDLYKALDGAMKELNKELNHEVATYWKQDPGQVRPGGDDNKVGDCTQRGVPDGKGGNEADAGGGGSPGTDGVPGPEGLGGQPV